MLELLSAPDEPLNERRTAVRYPFQTKTICHSIPIVTGNSCLATVQDISVAGIGLVCDGKFEVGTWLLVEALGPGSHSLMPPTLRVVHTHKQASGAWQVGCVFREPIDEGALRALLAEAAHAKAPAAKTAALEPGPFQHLEGLAQALFEESGDALFIFDPDSGQLLDANSMAQRMTGLPLRDLLHMDVTYLFRPDGGSRLDDLIQASRRTRVFHSQPGYFLRTTQDAVWVPVNLSVSRLHVKPATLGLVTARDVRAQHEAYARLKKTEADWRRLLDMVPDCFWAAEIDPSGQWAYRYISPGVEKLTGQPLEHFQPGIHRWWSIVHPADQPLWEKALVRCKSGHSGQEEYRIVRSDDAVRRVRDNVLVKHGADGKTLWLAGVVTDITDWPATPPSEMRL